MSHGAFMLSQIALRMNDSYGRSHQHPERQLLDLSKPTNQVKSGLKKVGLKKVNKIQIPPEKHWSWYTEGKKKEEAVLGRFSGCRMSWEKHNHTDNIQEVTSRSSFYALLAVLASKTPEEHIQLSGCSSVIANFTLTLSVFCVLRGRNCSAGFQSRQKKHFIKLDGFNTLRITTHPICFCEGNIYFFITVYSI